MVKRVSIIAFVAMLLIGMGADLRLAIADEVGETAPADTPAADKHVYFIAEEAPVFRRGFMVSQFMLNAEESEGRFSIVKETFEPGFDSYPFLHSHHWHSEVFYIVSGKMQWTVNDETRVLGPGALVYIPPRSPHAAKVIGDEAVEAIMVYEPAGYEKNYQRRGAMTEEQLEDTELVRRMMKDADFHPERQP